MSPTRVELGIGCGAGLLAYLAWRGLNVLPVLFLAVLAWLLLATSPRLRQTGSRPEPSALAAFEDIGGHQAAKRELIEALDFINRHEEAGRLGIRPLRGVLLAGPPGTGKTLLARAAASYTGAAFLAASGSEFIEMYAGVGAQRVRGLFSQARALARREGKGTAVVFVDEIEVLAPERGTHRSHLEYDQTLNQLLVEMDGIGRTGGVRVLVIGATNRQDLLDQALLRPGRFDRVIQVGMPDRSDRLAILQLHTKSKPLADGVDLAEVAQGTLGFSGAHLESVANEAAILAWRDGCQAVEDRHFREAVDKVILGERLGRRPTPAELLRIATHEAGHAVMAELVGPGSVAVVTIASRGAALGYVRQVPAEDPLLLTREHLENNLDSALAGPLAEEMLCGSRSTGAAEDLRSAADTARQLVLSGMTSLGAVPAATVPGEVLHRAVCQVLGEREAATKLRLEQAREALGRVREALLARESITGTELRAAIAGGEPAA